MTDVQLTLPSGRVIRVCAECACEFPRHQYFCDAIHEWSRSAVLREMVRVDDRLRELESLIEKGGGSAQIHADMRVTYNAKGRPIRERTTLLRLAGERFLMRTEFWAWAWWLGLDFWSSTKEAREDVRAEVEEMRARMNRKRLEDAAA